MVAANEEATEPRNSTGDYDIITIILLPWPSWLTFTEYMCNRWPLLCSACRSYNLILLFSFITYHRIFVKRKTTNVTSGAGTAYPSGASEFIPGSWWMYCCSICAVFHQLYHCLHICLLYHCLCIDIRLLIALW